MLTFAEDMSVLEPGLVNLDSEGVMRISTNDVRWRALIERSPDASVFHDPAWSHLLATAYRYKPFVLAVNDGNGNLRAGVPIMEVSSRLTGRRLVSLPFSDFCHPLADDDSSLQRLLQALPLLQKKAAVSYVELRCSLPGLRPSKVQYVRHTLDLALGTDGVFKGFSKMHKRNIKKGEKAGVVVKMSRSRESVEAFYRLHVETRQRQGVPVQPKRYFRLFWQHIIESGLGFIMLANDSDNDCVAAAVFLTYKKTMLYKYGASIKRDSVRGANNLLFWQAIKWAVEHDYQAFDFGRTDIDNEGLRAFKRGWGTVEMQLADSFIPTQDIERPGRVSMNISAFVIKRSPKAVCRLSGEALYRHYG